jgi:hypothetical protein
MLPIAMAEGHDPVLWNIVFAARASDVRDVWVQGEQLIQQGHYTRIEEAQMLEAIHRQTVDLLDRRHHVKAIPMV